MKPTVIRISLLLALIVTATAGCDSQPANEDTPPALISQEAFQLQTDLFGASSGKTLAKLNFAAAALRVWPVSVILQANLIVPAVVTAAALEDEPELIDGTWVWSSDVVAQGNGLAGATALNFRLEGRPVADGVDWSMMITASEPLNGQVYDAFELYTAHTSPGGLTGSWQLYYRIDGERRNVLNAAFTQSDSDEKSLTFSIPESADEHAGDWVRYEVEGDDRRFVWQQIEPDLTHDVRWNATSKTGSITASNYNGGTTLCWDAELEDSACAENGG